ncbi:hypothetical protein [Frankia sp. Cr1]|uniref:hypothetical protein n=1 Tax=Frankia sp. Cr1 TaxID=3073931 RepID=UPI002AD255E9|nr:hypothetical protein [Frankia sp. Cr1]
MASINIPTAEEKETRTAHVLDLLGRSLRHVHEFLTRVGFTPDQPPWPTGPLTGTGALAAARNQVGIVAGYLADGGCGAHRMEDELHAHCARAWLDLSTHALYYTDGQPGIDAPTLARDVHQLDGYLAFWSQPRILPGGVRVDYRQPRRRRTSPRPPAPRPKEGTLIMPIAPATGDDDPGTHPVTAEDVIDLLLDAGFTRADPPVSFTAGNIHVTLDHQRHITVSHRHLSDLQPGWEARFSPDTPQVLVVAALRVAGVTIP